MTELSRSDKELRDYPETTVKVGPDGFIRLMDHMGDDNKVYDCARTSFNLTEAPRKDVRSLIRRLVRHKHTTPIEMVEFQFFVRCPMDCWRQWIRHRTAAVNERSTRYIDVPEDDFHETHPAQWRAQAKDKKQGSGGFLEVGLGAAASIFEHAAIDASAAAYRSLQDLGVANEQARKVLPLSTYTEAVWKIDLHNLMHFLGLRLALDAQLEIRQYADAIAQLIEPVVPLCTEAFRDFRLEAVTFSRLELEAIRRMLSQLSNLTSYGDAFGAATKGEVEEFRAKWANLCDVQPPV
jgi:thymidylate synthase (FAD)